jgi:carbamate kinase
MRPPDRHAYAGRSLGGNRYDLMLQAKELDLGYRLVVASPMPAERVGEGVIPTKPR